MKTFNTGRRQVLARLALNAGGADLLPSSRTNLK
jgi:hypothetical protein